MDYCHEVVPFSGYRKGFEDLHGGGVVVHGQESKGAVEVTVGTEILHRFLEVSVHYGLKTGVVSGVHHSGSGCVFNYSDELFPVLGQGSEGGNIVCH